MLATAKNIDVFCLQLKNHFGELDHPLQHEVSVLLESIKKVIKSPAPIKKQVMGALPAIFDLRIKGIKWLVKQGEFDFVEILNEVYPQIEKLRKNPLLEVLAENILFALRCNQRVVKKLIGIEGFSEENLSNGITQLPNITYQQFVAGIAFSIPDQEGAQKVLDWINSSLCIEFVAVAAVTIDEDDIQLSRENINELAFIISDAAQDYMALATELGLFKTESNPHSHSQLTFDNDFISEQKAIADQGLSEQDWHAA
jgi:hypothetical protein